jgi:hypothetical protein
MSTHVTAAVIVAYGMHDDNTYMTDDVRVIPVIFMACY